MEKIIPEKPILILLYGFPGSGKTYFSRQFCDEVHSAHLEEDRIRFELFEKPRYTRQENFALNRIMTYMTGEFLNAGISVVYDTNSMRRSQRRTLRELAKKHGVEVLVIWFQLDADTAYARNSKRDRRRIDDRFAAGYNIEQFKEIAAHMQQPESPEEFIVVSGKYTYASQRSSIVKKLADKGVIKPTSAVQKMVKPDLVNLVPNGLGNRPKNGAKHIILR